MIKIYNRKINTEILIDNSLPTVRFTPNDYNEDNPHVLLEMDHIYFDNHCFECNVCNTFRNTFGTKITDWFIEYHGKAKRLNLLKLSSKRHEDNRSEFISSYWFKGSRLKLNIDVDTIETLNEQLQVKERLEKYEECSFIRDKMRSFKNEI